MTIICSWACPSHPFPNELGRDRQGRAVRYSPPNKLGGAAASITHAKILKKKAAILGQLFTQHAQATTIELRIEASSEQTKIEFSDNGIGFNLMEVKNGNGLINVQERCKIIEGTVDFSSNEAMGTKICIILRHQ
jgi:phosphosulfolactate synthase (CoM biosynthesis protein A)